MEIRPNHVRLFVVLPPAIPVAGAVKILKGVSALALLRMFPHLKTELRDRHLWSPSYYVGTSGEANEETIKSFIERCGHVAGRR